MSYERRNLLIRALHSAGDLLELLLTARVDDQNKTENRKTRKVFKAQQKKTIVWCAMETVGKREHKEVSGRMVRQFGFQSK